MPTKRRPTPPTPAVPPSPYDFEETVRRVLKAPPLPVEKRKGPKKKADKQH